jgi:YesN/AraC family two-component response regulator
MKRTTVLLAEDHQIVREGFRSLLEYERDIEVVGEVETGRQAVAIVKKLRPDVVLMDIAMPRLNGLEATRQIRRDFPDTKVVILSAYNDDAYVEQVMRQKPTAAQFNRVATKLKQNGVDGDDVALKDAYFKTAVVSQKKLDSTTHLLSIFAEHLSMKSNQIMMQQANAEPPVITRAKQYIQEHFIEELSLERLAAAVHTSTFYFCKLFKKATGINFNQYVARTRAEKAKNLLLNLNLRISEIAYEVGFQSLTHFNRMFKKIVGQSPTEYRAQLANA